MATLIRYVNTVAHTSGDGTTNGTGNGGTNSFASLSEAEVALRQTLTSVACDVVDELGNATIALDILCVGTTADTVGAVAFANAAWVTDATHRIRVRLNGTGAGAKWDSALYRLVVTPGYNAGVLSIGKVVHLTLQDLQVEATGGLDGGVVALKFGDFAWDVNIVRGFYRQTGTTGAYDAATRVISNAAGDTTAFVLRCQNVTVVAADAVPFRTNGNDSTAGTVIAYNCTIVNRGATGRDVLRFNKGTGGTFRFKNVLLQGVSGGGGNYTPGNQNATETATILTTDTSSPTAGLQSKTCTFVDAVNWDYHEVAGDPSIAAGTDLHADTYYAFANDCDGVARVAPWDVGADQIAAASTGGVGHLGPGLVGSPNLVGRASNLVSGGF